jgi:tRNA G37 N-methylase Trm5
MRRRLVLLLLAHAAALGCLPAFAQNWATIDVLYVPTPHDVVEEMLRMAGVGKGDVLYDLGSGDGRIPIAAARKFGIRATGIDIDPERIREAEGNASAAGVAALVRFRQEDLFKTDFRDATVVTLYLQPHLNLRLRPKLRSELRPGTRIVSHDFAMGDDWPAERALKLENDTIYFWTIPAR